MCETAPGPHSEGGPSGICRETIRQGRICIAGVYLLLRAHFCRMNSESFRLSHALLSSVILDER